MRRFALVLAVLVPASFVFYSPLFAHEGHEYKDTGVVKAINGNQVELETKNGKKITAFFTQETKFFREKKRAAQADLKVGDRTALIYVEKEGKYLIQEVLLGSNDADKAHPAKEK